MNLTYNVTIVDFQSFVGIYGSLERLLQQVCKGDSFFLNNNVSLLCSDHVVVNF